MSTVHDRTTRLLLACGLVTALFTPVILVEGALRSDYAALHHFGSELSLGDRGWVQVTNFIVAGLAAMAFSVGLRRALRDGRGSLAAPVLTAAVGISLVVGGVFVTDPLVGYPAGSTGTLRPTLSGLVHDGNSVPFHVVLIGATVVLAWRFAHEPGRRSWAWYCAATGILVAVTSGTSAALFDAEAQVGAYHGLWQRFSLAIGLGWFGVMAWLLGRGDARPRTAEGRSSARTSAEGGPGRSAEG